MLMVTALIQPFRLNQVERVLLSAGLREHTVGECAGYGVNPDLMRGTRTGFDIPEFVAKLKIEVPVCEHRCEAAIQAIIRGARLGRAGDGKIFVSELDQVIELSTGLPDNSINDDLSVSVIEAAE